MTLAAADLRHVQATTLIRNTPTGHPQAHRSPCHPKLEREGSLVAGEPSHGRVYNISIGLSPSINVGSPLTQSLWYADADRRRIRQSTAKSEAVHSAGKLLLAETRFNDEIRGLQADLHAANIARPCDAAHELRVTDGGLILSRLLSL